MTSAAQRKATAAHRRRTRARGMVRVEVRAAEGDARLIRAIADTLRGEPAKARGLRATLETALATREAADAFDIFGSDLPDDAFAGVFEQPRPRTWREIDL